jgi:hypoxanthine phosphoribosyltransferase
MKKKSKSQLRGTSKLSWSDIQTQVKTIAYKVRKTGFQFDKIATLTRGGLVPARLVADQFDIKVILVNEKHIPKMTLFVDDIYDSGKTFKKILPLVKDPSEFIYATLVARKGMKYPQQLVFANQTRGNEYVVFPWDKLESQSMKEWLKP